MLNLSPVAASAPSIPKLPSPFRLSFTPSLHLSTPFLPHHHHLLYSHNNHAPLNPQPLQKGLNIVSSTAEPLKVMISGAPASGKGTQCEMIAQKFGVVHISTGDILRAEVAAGTEIGNTAKEYMNTGRLVPDEIVAAMVIARLSLKDVKEKGWLLDGYPRGAAQAEGLEKLNIRPDVFIMLDVPDDALIDRCIGRRLDPLTGKIYHIKNFPPENEEISGRLVTRPDDTEEKVKSRLQIYKQNTESILSTYADVMRKIDGNRHKEAVFNEIESILMKIKKDKEDKTKSGKLASGDNQLESSSSDEKKWRGIPTRLNNIPHSREIRRYFYADILQATKRAVQDGRCRLKVISVYFNSWL